MTNNMTFPKRKVLKRWVRFSLLSIIMIFFISSFYIIYKSFNRNNQSAEILLYSYNIKQSIDYRVNLYDNSYIESNYLGKNETYISDLIKDIEIDYKYNYFGSKILALDCTYSVKAIINGEYALEEGNSKVWTKEYVLVEEKTKKISDKNTISVIETVKLDYNYYNDVVSEFRQELKIPIDSTLSVVFSINISGEVSGEKINDTKEIVLKIPLNQQAFKMTEVYEGTFNKNITPKVDEQEKFNLRKLIAGALLFFTSILLFILLFREIFNIPKKNIYTTKLNKILKEYGDIIIEIVNPVNEENMDIVEVKNFNEMIDLEEELRVPIMFYETIEYLEGEFTLIHNNILYKFVLKNE